MDNICQICDIVLNLSEVNASQHKVDAITTHIDIIASKVNDLMHTENTGKTDENSITPKVTDIAPTVEENAACQINTTDSKKMEEQIKTLQNVCSVLNNEIKKLVNSQLEMIKKYKKLEELAEKFEEEKKEMGRQFISKDIIIAEQEMRLQIVENVRYDGVLIWKINNFTHRRQEALSLKVNSIYSTPFNTSREGYKLSARVYLNGDGMGKTTHISLFIVIMKGTYDALLHWPFNKKITLYILDQDGRDHVVDAFQPDVTSSSFKRPTNDMNIASGCPLFMPLSYLEMKGRQYVKDDCMFVKVVVDAV